MQEFSFEGSAYAPAFAGERKVRLSLTETAIEAVTDAGLTITVPYAECQIERGGANGQVWFCHTADRKVTLLCGSPGFGDALRTRGGDAVAPAVDRLRARGRQHSRRGLFLTLGVSIAVVALATAGVLGILSAARGAVDALPTSVDERMGQLAYRSMAAKARVVEDPEIQAAIRTIVERLGASTRDEFDYRVHVFDEPIKNAFALPGGILVVYTGLIEATDDPAQLAGVLAHEMSHVQRRHGMRRIAQSLGVVAALQLVVGDVSGLAAVAVDVLHEGTVNSYSRQQEREADLDAVEMLANAGIDPRALAGFFEVLRRDQAEQPALPAWLATHPDLGVRIADVRARAAQVEVRDPRPLSLDWPEVQRRAESADPGPPTGAGGGARLLATWGSLNASLR